MADLVRAISRFWLPALSSRTTATAAEGDGNDDDAAAAAVARGNGDLDHNSAGMLFCFLGFITQFPLATVLSNPQLHQTPQYNPI
jgi:hypothetical protein